MAPFDEFKDDFTKNESFKMPLESRLDAGFGDNAHNELLDPENPF